MLSRLCILDPFTVTHGFNDKRKNGHTEAIREGQFYTRKQNEQSMEVGQWCKWYAQNVSCMLAYHT